MTRSSMPSYRPLTNATWRFLARRLASFCTNGLPTGVITSYSIHYTKLYETFADEVFSIGDYILTGGELPSLVMTDAICRNIEGVLGNTESLEMESFETPLLEAPSFGKPPLFEQMDVPSEFLKGNHSKIAALKFALSECKTKFFRPEQLKRHRKRTLYEK